MKKNFKNVFNTEKPIIAMVHLPALPGTPLYDSKSGLENIVTSAQQDLIALQDAGVDAIMFGNENDRPYELKVNTASTATMAYVIGRLKENIKIPFGVNVLWDPLSTIAVAAATGAHFVREIFTGVYASDMGIWEPKASEAIRYKKNLDRNDDLLVFYNISAEFAYSLDQRPIEDRARSVVFSSMPDAVLVSGQITGEAANLNDLKNVKNSLPNTPVLANTGVKLETLEEILSVADGVIVGSSLKIDGNTWKAIDPERAKEFMKKAKSLR